MALTHNLNLMTQSDIRTIVTKWKEIKSNLDAQLSTAQKSIELIQSQCNHTCSTQIGPYKVCETCDKVL